MEQIETTNREISYKTIIKFFLVLIAIVFLYYFRDLLVIAFVAFILSSIFRPGVNFLVAHRWPRKLAVLLFFILFLGLVAAVFSLIVPLLVRQIIDFVNNLPHYFDALKNTAVWFRDRLAFLSLSPETTSGMVEAVEGTLTTSAGSIFETIKNFFGSLARFVIMIAITFYILIEEDSVKGFFRVAVPRDKQEFLTRLFVKIQTQIGSWLKGQLILSFIVSCLIFIILTILNVKYALVIALIAFAGEFFPYVGPLIAAIPAVLLALIDSPVKAVLVIISFIVMQQIDNHIIVPQVMKKAIGLNPLISIFALYIGARLAGVLGVVIALPAAATLIVALEQIYLPAGETRNN